MCTDVYGLVWSVSSRRGVHRMTPTPDPIKTKQSQTHPEETIKK